MKMSFKYFVRFDFDRCNVVPIQTDNPDLPIEAIPPKVSVIQIMLNTLLTKNLDDVITIATDEVRTFILALDQKSREEMKEAGLLPAEYIEGITSDYVFVATYHQDRYWAIPKGATVLPNAHHDPNALRERQEHQRAWVEGWTKTKK